MPKAKRTYQKPLKIEMDFEEALERFGTTDPSELPDDKRLSNKRRSDQERAQPTAPKSKQKRD